MCQKKFVFINIAPLAPSTGFEILPGWMQTLPTVACKLSSHSTMFSSCKDRLHSNKCGFHEVFVVILNDELRVIWKDALLTKDLYLRYLTGTQWMRKYLLLSVYQQVRGEGFVLLFQHEGGVTQTARSSTHLGKILERNLRKVSMSFGITMITRRVRISQRKFREEQMSVKKMERALYLWDRIESRNHHQPFGHNYEKMGRASYKWDQQRQFNHKQALDNY